MAAALLHEPEILFLDEPTSGADPLARRAFWRRITALAEQGVTIIVTTHFMQEAEYCDRIAIMDAGRVLAEDARARFDTWLTSRQAKSLRWRMRSSQSWSDRAGKMGPARRRREYRSRRGRGHEHAHGRRPGRWSRGCSGRGYFARSALHRASALAPETPPGSRAGHQRNAPGHARPVEHRHWRGAADDTDPSYSATACRST